MKNFKLNKKFKFNRELTIGLTKSSRRLPGSGIKNLAKGQARNTSRKADTTTNKEVYNELVRRIGFDFLVYPFKDLKKKKALRYAISIYIADPTDKNAKRVENSSLALVREPLYAGTYGVNSQFTVQKKGFNRYGIDTGQFVQSLGVEIE